MPIPGLARPAPPSTDAPAEILRFEFQGERDELGDVVAVAAGQRDRESTGLGPIASSLLARTCEASATARVQSIWSAACSSASNNAVAPQGHVGGEHLQQAVQVAADGRGQEPLGGGPLRRRVGLVARAAGLDVLAGAVGELADRRAAPTPRHWVPR